MRGADLELHEKDSRAREPQICSWILEGLISLPTFSTAFLLPLVNFQCHRLAFAWLSFSFLSLASHLPISVLRA